MPLLVPVVRGAAAPLALPDLSEDRQMSAGSGDPSPDAKLLGAMVANPDGTQQDWATATGVAKSNVNRRLMRLKGKGLVRKADGGWTVTKKGTRLARSTQKKSLQRLVHCERVVFTVNGSANSVKKGSLHGEQWV